MAGPSRIRTVVADDAVLLRSGVVSVLSDGGYDVVAAVGSGPDLVQAARELEPGLVVADIRMPPTHTDDGIVAVRAIRRRRPETAVVLLSQYVAAEEGVDLFQENPAGLGYLLKDRVIQIEDFLAAVHRVANGGSAIDPDVVARLIGGRSSAGGADGGGPNRTSGVPGMAGLTERERDVLALMAEGLSNGAIAASLRVGARTVETYVNGVFTKLGLQPDASEHRRVKAVLAHLRRHPPSQPNPL